MANGNPSAVLDSTPNTIQATTAIQVITLDPGRCYTLAHCSEDQTGASATFTIYISTVDGVVASPAAAAGRGKLVAGSVLEIGPGFSQLFFTSTGNVTFNLIGGTSLMGIW